MVPIWGWPGARYRNMNVQITLAATALIASGRKMTALAADS